MKNDKIGMITRTAVLLAVVVAVQMAGRSLPYSNFIVGPLVNMSILVAAMTAGIGGGVAIAILSPFTSLVNNHAPLATALLLYAPAISVANLILVIVFYFLYSKNKYAGIVLGSILKFGFLYGSINLFLNIFQFPKFAQKLLAMFSWPQLVTALIGGIIAIPVITRISKTIGK
ncbi:ECF transporter S component [Ruminiclostridium josui]|uniref:ECF transporter S component n=1 Tax=Ruminiclostridium josui TaxID=1499 RepID=UPI000464F50E|nr:ECF transporter S component [Ruminiclostridium josui]